MVERDTVKRHIVDSRRAELCAFFLFAGMGQKGLAGERKGRDYKVEGPIDNNISAPRALREKRDSLAESP